MSTALRAIERELRARHFQPPPRLTVSQWADRYRVLPRTGRWRTDRTPYLRGIMDALSDDSIERIAFMKPTQVGGTEVLLNALGFYAAEDPCPILLIQPTVDMAKGFSRERVDDLLSMSPRLRGLVRKSGRRSSEDTLQFKSFPGGFLAIIGANSPSGLRSRAIRVLLADELSAWPESAGDEGDPLELAERRTATFWDRKIVGTSTPTVHGFCAITRLWEDSDQRRFFVPCPHCGEYQPFRWRNSDDETLHNIEVEEPGRYRLLFERDDADEVIPESVTYTCDNGCVIEERHKPQMLAAGEWRAFRTGRRIAGFHLNALYSPWVSWAEICSKFLKAKSSPELLKTWVNTFGGMPWKDAGDRIEPHALMARAEALDPVPPDIAGVTIGVDVQGSWLDCQLVAWGAREESWVLARHQIEGDPESLGTWDALDEWLWQDHGAPLFGVAVDTGYLPERVWRWMDRQPAARRRLLFGTKGMPGRRPTFVTPPGATTTKKQRRPWLVSVDEGKDLLARRLRAQPGPGFVHFADTLDPAYFEQLTAEQVVTVYRAGRPVREWRLIPGRRNEALDTYLLALAALYARGPKLVGRLHEYVEKRRQEANGAPESAPASTEPQESSLVRERIAARRAAPSRGGWVTGWRR
jgi:phage terminase large subunit GpA-like protein